MREVVRISRSFKSAVEPTEHVKQCAAAFGIGIDESIEIVLYRDLGVDIGNGEVIFFNGESGAGKSCALRDVVAAARRIDGVSVIADLPDVAELPDVPLVDQFAALPLNETLALLSMVGIAEPFVFLRKPCELSDGQRYRFLLGLMIHEARRHDSATLVVVAIDEFLAFLDPETAKNVAYQTRRAATKFGLCFVVASTHRHYIDDLQPDLLVTMRLNMPPELSRGNAGLLRES